MKLTKNFTLDEMIISQEAIRSGIRNYPNSQQIESLKALCFYVLQPLRDKLRRPVVISSGFRNRTINTRIGGSSGSQHTRGEAADFIVLGMTAAEIIVQMKKLNLPVDQCIDEFGAWVHVSYGPRHRRQYLTARRENGKNIYRVMK